jgi:hypothetical protein
MCLKVQTADCQIKEVGFSRFFKICGTTSAETVRGTVFSDFPNILKKEENENEGCWTKRQVRLHSQNQDSSQKSSSHSNW